MVVATVRRGAAMIEIHEILCPTDFSDASRQALAHAIALARWYGSHLTALHVIQVPLVPQPPIFGVAFADATPPQPVSYEEREHDLRAWIEPARTVGLRVDVRVDEGDPARRIVKQARASAADLVVMGTHGLSGFERLMLGSVTERVLRQAPCPVLTVPPAPETDARVPYARLLCPVDFSESSLEALQFALSLAKEADARLTVLHVVDWPAANELLSEHFDPPDLQPQVEARVRERLEALVTEEARTFSRPTTSIVYGKPYRQILETARQEQSDLIVIGVHGRNPLDLALFGSTTNHVVRRAPCPVLTLRR